MKYHREIFVASTNNVVSICFVGKMQVNACCAVFVMMLLLAGSTVETEARPGGFSTREWLSNSFLEKEK